MKKTLPNSVYKVNLYFYLQTKRQADRVFDKNTTPGCMPKVPQQPNFSDCGLFMLQYVESFFSHPIENYDTSNIHLRTWFDRSIAENKRREIFDFIKKKIELQNPLNLSRVPSVNFEPTDEVVQPGGEKMDGDDNPDYDSDEKEDSDDLFEPIPPKPKPQRRKSDSDDHNYAKGNSEVTSASDDNKE